MATSGLNLPAFKLRLGDDVRRWSPKSVPTIDDLTSVVRQLFGLSGVGSVKLTYHDSDGDMVTLAGDADVSEMLRQNLSPVRIDCCLVPPAEDEAMDIVDAPTDPKSLDKRPVTSEGVRLPVDTPAEGARGHSPREEEMLPSQEDEVPNDDDRGPWSVAAVDQFVNYLATQLTLMDVDDLCLAEVVKLLSASHGKLDEAGVKVVSDCLRHAGDVNPRVVQKLKLLANRPESLGLGVEVPRHVRDFVSQGFAGQVAVHEGVSCDSCATSPIRGVRYKSLCRPDFDVCSQCYANKGSSEWASDPFVTLDMPLSHPSDLARLFVGHMSNMASQFMGQEAWGFSPFERCGRPCGRSYSHCRRGAGMHRQGEQQQPSSEQPAGPSAPGEGNVPGAAAEPAK